MEFYNSDSLYYIFGEVIKLHYYRAHKSLEKVGLYPGQPQLLFSLLKKDGQSQKELSGKLKVKPATITVMIKRMEKAGLIYRKSDEEDQRISRVYLTDKGKEVSGEVKELFKTINKECFSNFTDEEQVILRRLLLQIKENLKIGLEDEKSNKL
ncbi:MarR family winged helix-turn-helix transcriptional regulator [Clostridium hydrogeniformans]|uniref:MarR family winged helix-turn-helix transcriptional regulator n=1 Tax=Clostridium hydrogeniformans TaxID=349933 RepID=UPI000481CE4D|nr:MarR family transcriptional regulator [Clostridium hydrogeniformans]